MARAATDPEPSHDVDVEEGAERVAKGHGRRAVVAGKQRQGLWVPLRVLEGHGIVPAAVALQMVGSLQLLRQRGLIRWRADEAATRREGDRGA